MIPNFTTNDAIKVLGVQPYLANKYFCIFYICKSSIKQRIGWRSRAENCAVVKNFSWFVTAFNNVCCIDWKKPLSSSEKSNWSELFDLSNFYWTFFPMSREQHMDYFHWFLHTIRGKRQFYLHSIEHQCWRVLTIILHPLD